MGQGSQDTTGRMVRRKHLDRMRIKGENAHPPTSTSSINDRLMTEVQSIKDTKSQTEITLRRRKFLESMKALHTQILGRKSAS